VVWYNGSAQKDWQTALIFSTHRRHEEMHQLLGHFSPSFS